MKKLDSEELANSGKLLVEVTGLGPRLVLRVNSSVLYIWLHAYGLEVYMRCRLVGTYRTTKLGGAVPHPDVMWSLHFITAASETPRISL